MTDDFPERELDTDDLFEIYSRGHSNVAGNVSSSTEVQTSHKTSRREVRWKLGKNANNRSLDSIARQFEDYLDCLWASSADSSLRRITASPHKWVSHRCPEYLREEITLTADASRSAVVAYQYPNQSEICTICGHLVQYPSNPVPYHTAGHWQHLTFDEQPIRKVGSQVGRRTREARFICVLCNNAFTTNYNLRCKSFSLI